MTEARFSALECSVKRIENAICGDPDLKIKGIAAKVDEHDKYIAIDKRQKWMISGAASFIAFVFSLIVTYLGVKK